MELQQARAIIQTNIRGRLRHQDYKRTVDMAIRNKRLITGEEAGKMLERFVRRETEEMFEQRERIFQSITPALCSGVQSAFYKVSRNTKVTKRLDIKNPTKKQVVESMIASFSGNNPDINGLDYYLQNRFVELSFIDPNAWVVTEFPQFDFRTEYPSPRPFEVSAAMAINFSVVNEITNWLLVMDDISVPKLKEGVTKDQYYAADPYSRMLLIETYVGKRYTLYADTIAVVYEQVNRELLPEGEIALVDLDTQKDDMAFHEVVYVQNLSVVPAIRIGYKRDDWTDGRTFISPMERAIPYMMKSIKTVSELDLTMTLHAFPQKIQYAQRCTGAGPTEPCSAGKTLEGSTCKHCNGSGWRIPSSAQDAMTLPFPENKEDMYDLSGVVQYVAPPADLIKFQSEYIDSLEPKVHKAVFNSTVFIQDSTVKTATEKTLDMESVHDTLSPFAKKSSLFWKFQARLFMELAEVNEPEASVTHAYPNDLKLKTMGNLIVELKDMNDSGAPSFVKDAINDDLAQLIYAEDILGYMRYKVKKSFAPFPGKTEDEIQFLLNTEYVTEFNKILYANFEAIFAEAERDDPAFFLKNFSEQWKIIGDKVNTIKDDIAKGAADRFNKQQDLIGAAKNDGQGRFGAGSKAAVVEEVEE
jgi:hypothetical protein